MRGHEHGIPVVLSDRLSRYGYARCSRRAAGPSSGGRERGDTRGGGARSDTLVKFLEDNGWVTGYEAIVNI